MKPTAFGKISSCMRETVHDLIYTKSVWFVHLSYIFTSQTTALLTEMLSQTLQSFFFFSPADTLGPNDKPKEKAGQVLTVPFCR